MSLRDFINNQQVKNRNTGRSIAKAENAKADAVRSLQFKDRVQNNKGLKQERDEGVKNRNIQRRIAKEESNQTNELEKQTRINTRIEKEEKKQTRLQYSQLIESEKQTKEANRASSIQEEQKNIIKIDTKIDRVKEAISEEIEELEKGNNIKITFFLKDCILNYSDGERLFMMREEVLMGKKVFKSQLENIQNIPNLDVINIYQFNGIDSGYLDYILLKLFPESIFGKMLKQEFENEIFSEKFNEIIKNYLSIKNYLLINNEIFTFKTFKKFITSKKFITFIYLIMLSFVHTFSELYRTILISGIFILPYFQIKDKWLTLPGISQKNQYAIYFSLNSIFLYLFIDIMDHYSYENLLFQCVFGFILSSVISLMLYDYIVYINNAIKNKKFSNNYRNLNQGLSRNYKKIYKFISEYNKSENKINYFYQTPSYLTHLNKIKKFKKEYKEYCLNTLNISEEKIIKLKIESLKALRKRLNHYDMDNLNNNGNICTTEKRKTLDFEYFNTEEFVTILNT